MNWEKAYQADAEGTDTKYSSAYRSPTMAFFTQIGKDEHGIEDDTQTLLITEPGCYTYNGREDLHAFALFIARFLKASGIDYTEDVKLVEHLDSMVSPFTIKELIDENISNYEDLKHHPEILEKVVGQLSKEAFSIINQLNQFIRYLGDHVSESDIEISKKLKSLDQGLAKVTDDKYKSWAYYCHAQQYIMSAYPSSGFKNPSVSDQLVEKAAHDTIIGKRSFKQRLKMLNPKTDLEEFEAYYEEQMPKNHKKYDDLRAELLNLTRANVDMNGTRLAYKGLLTALTKYMSIFKDHDAQKRYEIAETFYQNVMGVNLNWYQDIFLTQFRSYAKLVLTNQREYRRESSANSEIDMRNLTHDFFEKNIVRNSGNGVLSI